MRRTVAIITLAGVMLSTPVYAADKWDTTDKVLAGAFLAATFLDWRQTTHIAKDHFTYEGPYIDENGDEANGRVEVYNHWEMNPILGRYPTEAKVNKYFAISVASKLLIAHLLPSRYRKAWLGGMFLISGSLVVYNSAHGIKIEW